MLELSHRIHELDISLFEAIPSQTSDNDKQSLLLIQECVRNLNDYVYLEIGSHLGGTIQTHYLDPRCRKIYSIDKRPLFVPDERGENFEYSENSTERMLANLREYFPKVNQEKIVTFDCDASEVETGAIVDKPHLCFIDGEHTNKAVFSDFNFCLQVSHPDAIIAFHDACYVFEGIKTIKDTLKAKSIMFQGFMLEGSVYAILLNKAVSAYASHLEPYTQNESDYFKQARKDLRKIRLENRLKKDELSVYNEILRDKENDLQWMRNKEENLTATIQAKDEELQWMRDREARLTATIQAKDDELQWLREKEANLIATIKAKDDELQWLRDKEANLTATIKAKDDELQWLRDKEANLSAAVQAKDDELLLLRENLTVTIQAKDEELLLMLNEKEGLNKFIQIQDKELQRLHAIEDSTIWRATYGFRLLVNKYRLFKEYLKKSIWPSKI